MPSKEVAAAVIKSSPVPMSSAEAQESLDLLVDLCPFFLKKMDVGSEEWLEMPAPSTSSNASGSTSTAESSVDGSPRKTPSSPSKTPSSPSKTPSSPLKPPSSPRKTPGSPLKIPVSPGRIRGKDDSAEELLNRSPRRVRREGGGLREVRERIRREMESQD